MRHARWLDIALRRPGAQLWDIGAQALGAWRDGRRPVMAASAGLLSIVGDVTYSVPGLRPHVAAVGAVSAALPWRLELLRLPGSAFLPTAELPLPFAVIQIVVVLGLAELVLGRWATATVALAAHVASTLFARLLIALGTITTLGLPLSQTSVLDTGPSAMTAAVGTWLLLRSRAYWCAIMLGCALTLAIALQNNLDGREHLAAFGCGMLAAALQPTARALGYRVAAVTRGALSPMTSGRSITVTEARRGR